jgi:O-antigen ligase
MTSPDHASIPAREGGRWLRRFGLAALVLGLLALLGYPSWQTSVRQAAPPFAGVACVALLLAIRFGALPVPGAGAMAPREPVFDRIDGALIVAIVALLLASATWSPAPAHSLGIAMQIVAAIGLIMTMALIKTRLPADWLGDLVPLAAGLAAIGLLIMIEAGDTVRHLMGQRQFVTDSNRGAVLLAVMLPAATWLAWTRRGPILAFMLAVLIGFAVMKSYSESAKLALVAGIGAALLCRLMPRLGGFALVTLSLLLIAITPLLTPFTLEVIPAWLLANTSDLTFRARAEIWQSYAGLIEIKPWFGWGLDATRGAARLDEVANWSEAQRRLLALNHPHNAVLQVWVELGLAGAVLLAGLVVRVAERIARLGTAVRPLAAGTAMSVFAVSAVSHGAWQAWWFCMVAMVVVYLPTDAAPVREARNRT